jgi:hypothetical protein
VTDPTRVPPGIDGLIRSLVSGGSDEDRDLRASTFARGLALGALVGAAIAGSTIWQRRQAARPEPAAPADPIRGAADDAPGADSD